MEKAVKKYWPIFVFPTMAAFVIGFIIPFVYGIFLSFCKFTTVVDWKWVGIKNFTKIFVVNGPGSFTGIRVGLTVAKVMAYSLNIPVVPVSSLEVMASGYDEDVISLIDARRGYVYAGGYDRNLDVIYKDNYVLFSESGLKGVFISFDKFSMVW